jgi:glycine cleavage system H protein
MSSNILANLRYSKEHQWAKVEDDVVYVGITDYAQDSLGEVVYIDLPTIGEFYEAAEVVANIESVKTSSDVYNPIGGTIASINEELEDSPELVNEDCYKYYLYTLSEAQVEQLDSLMDDVGYKEYLKTLP